MCWKSNHIIYVLWSFFLKSCHLWDIVENVGRTKQVKRDNILWHMRFACWIKKSYRHTLRICNTYCFSAATMIARKRLSVTLTRTLPVLFSVCMLWSSIRRNRLSDFCEIRREQACKSFVKIGCLTGKFYCRPYMNCL